MKKIFIVLHILCVFLCSGCKLSVYNDEKNSNKINVPTTLINTSISSDEVRLTTLYNNCKRAVVTILNYASYYDRGEVVTTLYGSGSGFIYSYDDNYIYLYTNAHVVDVGKGYNQSYYEVVFHDGYRSYGKLSFSDGSEDVAIMSVKREKQDFLVVALANSESVKPGNNVFALGSPLGLEYANTITSGIVSNIKVEMETDDDGDGNRTTMYMIQVDASLNPGNSGGPLFNSNGEVIGVNTLKLMSDSSGDDVESFNFAIPINHFVIVANSLTENGIYTRPKLGITVIDLKDMDLKQREEYGITVNNGLYIENIVKNSASYGILNSKEIIFKINGVNISDLADFSCELYKYKVGDTISIETMNVSGKNISNYNIKLN